jgi:hypothetical protein
MADEDDRPRDAGSAADRGWDDGEDLTVVWLNAVAPEDIRELSGDIKAYHRELRVDRRRKLVGRALARPGATPLSIIAVALVLAALVATLIAVAMPNASRAPSQLVLAKTSASPLKHGLLPNVSLTRDGKTVNAQSLRPVVLAVVPDPCDCFALLNEGAALARSEQIRLDVVAPANDAESASQAGRLDKGRVETFTDAGAKLAAALGVTNAKGLTFVLVNRDGTVAAIDRSVTPQTVRGLTRGLTQMLAQTEPSD